MELVFPNDVRSPDDFFGRAFELETILEAHRSSEDRSVTIIGERRIGKTSIQKVSTKLLERENIHVLHLPFGGYIRSQDELAREILRLLMGAVENYELDEGDLDFGSFGNFVDCLRLIMKGYGRERYIITYDELDTTLYGLIVDKEKEEARSILSFLDSLIERDLGFPITFNFTLTQLPVRMDPSFNSKAIDKATLVPLKPMPSEEMEEMVRGILGKNKMKCDDNFIEELFRLSYGHPFFAKYVLHILSRMKTAAPLSKRFNAQMLEPALREMYSDSGLQLQLELTFSEIFSAHLGYEEKQLLLLLVQSGKDHFTESYMQSLGALYQIAANKLVGRGYWARGEAGEYQWGVQLLGKWLPHWENYLIECENLGLDEMQAEADMVIEINRTARRVFAYQEEVSLTSQEFDLLVLLCERLGDMVNKDEIVARLWPESEGGVTDGAISTKIARLRDKIGDSEKDILITIPKKGYRLEKARFI